MKFKLSYNSALLLLSASLSVACSGDDNDDAPEGNLSPLATRVAELSLQGNAERGGRLYDRFYRENPNTGFSPDSDTLLDGEGNVVNNDTGHGFRLKNFYGWDMRGAEGVYGPAYQNKDYVLAYNLVDDPMDRDSVVKLLVEGGAGAPAFGGTIPEADLGDLVEFVMSVREHRLPQPADIWRLDATAPKGYVLRGGADLTAGHQKVDNSCSSGECHGSDGTALLFDDGEFSLGTLSRASAYEVWLKILNGNPGTDMRGQIPGDLSWEEQSQMVLNVLAALCDTLAYPAGAATETDVSVGDPRCGAYLR